MQSLGRGWSYVFIHVIDVMCLYLYLHLGYAFHRQPSVCMFNLVKFSMPLFELIGAGEQVDSLVFPKEGRENATDEETLEQYRSTAKEFVQEVLNTEFKGWFMDRLLYKSSQKIGLDVEKKKPTSDDMEAVIVPLLDWLTDYQVDHHRFYRSLSNYKITSAGEEKDAQDAVDQHLVIITQDDAVLADCKAALKPWLSIYRHRLLDDAVDCSKRKERMDTVNPRFILRNSIAQNVIDAFEEDSLHDATLVLNACFEACIDPFKEHYDNPIIENWIAQPVPDEDLRCSCSS